MPLNLLLARIISGLNLVVYLVQAGEGEFFASQCAFREAGHSSKQTAKQRGIPEVNILKPGNKLRRVDWTASIISRCIVTSYTRAGLVKSKPVSEVRHMGAQSIFKDERRRNRAVSAIRLRDDTNFPVGSVALV